ncbi:MAG: trans-sialidase [Thermoproteota archaeon]|nr:trans-sialidase [Thermoproteota archaeon]
MATAKKTTRKSTTKKDLEAKIADLEAKLNKLAAAQDAKPAEAAPKPAETKPAPKPEPKEAPKPAEDKKPEGGGGPHAHDEKPKAEAPPKPAEKAPPASGELHERFREIPTGNWNTQKVAITGFTAPSNRYFGSRALVAEVEVTPSNWNDQKTKVTGYTAPSNKYFATKQRLAYHPEAKKFGTWINDAPAPKEAPKEAPKPAESETEAGGGPHAHDEKPKAEAKVNAADKAKEDYAAKMAKKGATLPKGFIKDAKANTGH